MTFVRDVRKETKREREAIVLKRRSPVVDGKKVMFVKKMKMISVELSCVQCALPRNMGAAKTL